jgi:hypothetical protein
VKHTLFRVKGGCEANFLSYLLCQLPCVIDHGLYTKILKHNLALGLSEQFKSWKFTKILRHNMRSWHVTRFVTRLHHLLARIQRDTYQIWKMYKKSIFAKKMTKLWACQISQNKKTPCILSIWRWYLWIVFMKATPCHTQ